MQHLDNNNMDELFRKAAADYPLKTNIEGWDDIFPLVAVTAPVTIHQKKRKILLTAVVLLFFSTAAVLLAAYQFSNHDGNSNKVAEKITKILPAPAPTNAIVDNPAIEETLGTAVAEVNFPGQQRQRKNKLAENNSAADRNKQTTNYSVAVKEGGRSNHAGMPVAFPLYSVEPIPAANIHNPLLNKLTDSSASTKKTVGKTITSLNKLADKTGRFYFGLEGGLQLNEVKGQGFTKTGLSAGAIAGFRLNKKLSVETGIAWSQKHFYTDGKYFDMSKALASMPPNMQVTSMSSCSNLLEIPLTVNYILIQRKSSNLFLNAGISSYILTKESNYYLAVINGQQQNAQGKYRLQRNYFSAVAQVGVGYEYKAANQIRLRIEPYIQIPLKGIGIGEVQVMTAGLHLAVIKSTRN